MLKPYLSYVAQINACSHGGQAHQGPRLSSHRQSENTRLYRHVFGARQRMLTICHLDFVSTSIRIGCRGIASNRWPDGASQKLTLIWKTDASSTSLIPSHLRPFPL